MSREKTDKGFCPEKINLHIHSTFSDGTDTPKQILAHPPYGNGSQMIVGEELEKRVKRLIEYGLQGLEGFYSRYPAELRAEILALAQKYHTELPYITAGSDYHGSNKRVRLADTGCPDAAEGPTGLLDFLKAVLQ